MSEVVRENRVRKKREAGKRAKQMHLVSMPLGSDPWLGSVRPKQPIFSPVASEGKYFSFCSSLPKVLIGCMTGH